MSRVLSSAGPRSRTYARHLHEWRGASAVTAETYSASLAGRERECSLAARAPDQSDRMGAKIEGYARRSVGRSAGSFPTPPPSFWILSLAPPAAYIKSRLLRRSSARRRQWRRPRRLPTSQLPHDGTKSTLKSVRRPDRPSICSSVRLARSLLGWPAARANFTTALRSFVPSRYVELRPDSGRIGRSKRSLTPSCWRQASVQFNSRRFERWKKLPTNCR